MWIIHNVNEQWVQLPNVPQEIKEEKILQHTTEPCGTGQKPQIFDSKTSA
jgi:hypothetical protein